MTCLRPLPVTVPLLQISEVIGDFPLVHPHRSGRPTRWCYIAMTDIEDPAATIKGIAKIDLMAPEGTEEAAVGRIEYPRGMTGGEAWFQPRYQDPSKCAGGFWEGSRDLGFFQKTPQLVVWAV